ncbi:MAG: divalent metal cation transporter [Candidatus Pacebacteria bacterium]|nr:divalent metal cation transporter [Candidatus Paceibacterota bacterium]MBP9851169.1 divalent metal cation transporter [Candidatus Paceibacterota bacterium]
MRNRVKEYWKALGPGLTTGAADDDPSGIATYSQVGASHGFSFAWLSLFSFPLMAVVNEMCARIGIVTGIGLAENIKRHYSKTVLYICTFLLVFANVFNIGADLGAMGKATELLFPKAPFPLLVILFAVLSLLLQVFIPYRKYSKYLKYLTFALFTYVLSALTLAIDWGDVLYHTIIPTMNFGRDEIILVCAVLGTTISPYLFFWQTSVEVEEQIMKGETTEESRRLNVSKKEINDMRLDVWSGALVSNLVMFSIIAVCGAVLFKNGITNIESAEQAALALRPFAGDFSYFLFTLGIIGTGLLAIPVLAGSASYAVSESLKWKEGLYLNFKQAYSFYGVIIAAVLLGIGLNFIGLHPIKTLIYSAVLNGIIAPIMIFFILRISSDANIMSGYKNNRITNIVGWFTFLIMSLVSIFVVVSLVL